MAWFADLAGKAENLLNNLDEQTGAALRNHNVLNTKKYNRQDYYPQAEPIWISRKPSPRVVKKKEINSMSPKATPSAMYIPNPPPIESRDYVTQSRSPSPKRRIPLSKKCILQKSPNTIVCDKQDADSIRKEKLEGVTYRMENLEIENTMLKNEHNVLNNEVAGLIDKLQQAHHGEEVVSDKNELITLKSELQHFKSQKESNDYEKETLSTHMKQLEKKNLELAIEKNKLKTTIQQLETDISVKNERITELDNKIELLTKRTIENTDNQQKTENELRHAQSTVNELHSELLKSNEECKRLEKDWETYKLRVKTMLSAKDKDIKALQKGLNFTEDTKVLVDQIETLKDERAVLSDVVNRIRLEGDDMKQYLNTLESRNDAAERVVLALRDALKDERAARTRAEAQCNAVTKDMKALQIETDRTIINLRTALNKKNEEFDHTRETESSSIPTTDSSALNVGDYGQGLHKNSIDDEKVYYLTQKLMQRQGQIDALMADNNIMRIQLQKMEEQKNKPHTVLQVQDTERKGVRLSTSLPFRLSLKLGVLIRRYPIIRIFVFVYMIMLHFWVITVLFTSTPEPQIQSKGPKS